MKLKIRNFAKIEEADIIIDGITVIAGENNTGKSTIGKVLFSIFNSLSNIDEKIYNERISAIDRKIRNTLRDNIGYSLSVRSIARDIGTILSRVNSKLFYNNLETNKPRDIILGIVNEQLESKKNRFPEITQSDWTIILNEIEEGIQEILDREEKDIKVKVLSDYFDQVFHSQIKPLWESSVSESVITLEIKNQIENLYFEGNVCKDLSENINLIHKAVYIDNPFIVDELSIYADSNPMNELLKDLLITRNSVNDISGIFEEIQAKEKLEEVYRVLENAIEGKIIIKQNDGLYLKNNKFQEPISVQNLSTGMKSFLILKLLLEKNILKEKDVVILDEPEIHLHPEWQVIYAELIVLLQKCFDLSMIVTSHSPYFVDAINIFSKKYEIDKKVNYYLSSNVENRVKMDNVTDKLDLIYSKMASPIQVLETLRYELNNK